MFRLSPNPRLLTRSINSKHSFCTLFSSAHTSLPSSNFPHQHFPFIQITSSSHLFQKSNLNTISSTLDSPPSSSTPSSTSSSTTALSSSPPTPLNNTLIDDPFHVDDPHLELKAHLISTAPADTRHFKEHNALHSPLPNASAISTSSSSISSSSSSGLVDITQPQSYSMLETSSPLSPHNQNSKEVAVDINRASITFQQEAQHTLPHPIWTADAVHSVAITHFHPECILDRLAYRAVRSLRFSFDVLSGYALGRIDERGWLNRVVFLETVAGVPGMVGAMVRHLNSLRRMDRDYGWIHTLLEEAENERMHLMTALVLKKPTALFRGGVLMTQGLFLIAFSLSYLASPRFAHRFVGYLEEEAVITYTKLIREIDNGHLPLFEKLPAPPVARDYWCLGDEATFRDVVLAIRADESHHREVNHTFAGLQHDCPNPFPPGH